MRGVRGPRGRTSDAPHAALCRCSPRPPRQAAGEPLSDRPVHAHPADHLGQSGGSACMAGRRGRQPLGKGQAWAAGRRAAKTPNAEVQTHGSTLMGEVGEGQYVAAVKLIAEGLAVRAVRGRSRAASQDVESPRFHLEVQHVEVAMKRSSCRQPAGVVVVHQTRLDERCPRRVGDDPSSGCDGRPSWPRGVRARWPCRWPPRGPRGAPGRRRVPSRRYCRSAWLP